MPKPQRAKRAKSHRPVARKRVSPKITQRTISAPIPPGAEAPLPAGYGVDLIVLQVRDPHWLHAYWELKPSTVAQGRTVLGKEGPGAEPTLRVFELEAVSDTQTRVSDTYDIQLSPYATDWFLEVGHSDRRWRVTVGLKGRSGRFVALAESNTVEPPPQGEFPITVVSSAQYA